MGGFCTIFLCARVWEQAMSQDASNRLIEPSDALNDEHHQQPQPEQQVPAQERPRRRKIDIKYIEQKSRRKITFTKRKIGLMKKARELNTLTGCDFMLAIASESGMVYTSASPKLQILTTSPEFRCLFQKLLLQSEDGIAPNDDDFTTSAALAQVAASINMPTNPAQTSLGYQTPFYPIHPGSTDTNLLLHNLPSLPSAPTLLYPSIFEYPCQPYPSFEEGPMLQLPSNSPPLYSPPRKRPRKG